MLFIKEALRYGFATVTALAKGTEILTHKVTFFTTETVLFARQIKHLSIKEVHLLERIYTIFQLRRRWMSRFDATSALEGLIEVKDIQLCDTVVVAEILAIMREHVKGL